MTKNQDRLRNGRVTQHASVLGERARPLRPPVGATSFNPEASTSRAHVSPMSSSKRHVSPTSPKAQKEELDASVDVPDSFPRDFYDTSLLTLYADNIARLMWKGDVA